MLCKCRNNIKIYTNVVRRLKLFYCLYTLEPFYKTIDYKMVWICNGLKMDPKNVVSKQKCLDYIEK